MKLFFLNLILNPKKNKATNVHLVKLTDMPTIVSDHFADELTEWNESLVFYTEEIKAFTHKLGEVIRRNSIIGIAEKVEAHQIRLNQIAEKFHKLQKLIHQQELALKMDDSLIDDSMISRESEKQQVDLRVKMQDIEKEYIDIKFDCYHFMAGVLRK